MTDLPTRRFVEVVCTNPKHEYWDQHDWDGNDCIVKVTEPLLSRVEWEATIEDDLRLLRDWAETCDHIDHHGYCQTHAVTPVDENGLCGIGRLIAAVKGET